MIKLKIASADSLVGLAGLVRVESPPPLALHSGSNLGAEKLCEGLRINIVHQHARFRPHAAKTPRHGQRQGVMFVTAESHIDFPDHKPSAAFSQMVLVMNLRRSGAKIHIHRRVYTIQRSRRTHSRCPYPGIWYKMLLSPSNANRLVAFRAKCSRTAGSWPCLELEAF
jgi:hypothetical protein